MRIVVVDDEAPARAKLRRLLLAEADVEIIAEITNGADAVEAIPKLRPDLLLLDVQMPAMDGFEVIASFSPDQVPRTVFITAYAQHAIRAFEVRAIDYLLKPVTPQRFVEMLSRVRDDMNKGVNDSDLITRIGDVARSFVLEPPYLKRLFLKGRTKAAFLSIEQIDWVEVSGNYLTLHVGNSMHLERGSMNEFAARLDPGQFLRINRSQVVRMDAIKELHPWSHGDYQVILKDGTRLMWSRRFRAANISSFTVRGS